MEIGFFFCAFTPELTRTYGLDAASLRASAGHKDGHEYSRVRGARRI